MMFVKLFHSYTAVEAEQEANEWLVRLQTAGGRPLWIDSTVCARRTADYHAVVTIRYYVEGNQPFKPPAKEVAPNSTP